MSNSDIIPNLLVTGASGNVGHELVKQLLASSPLTNQNVIAGVHTKNGAEKLSKYSGLKIVDLDYNKTDTITNAFRNVNSLFLLTIPNPDSIDSFVDLIKLAKHNGISYVVKLSVQETIDSAPNTWTFAQAGGENNRRIWNSAYFLMSYRVYAKLCNILRGHY